jgi:MoxR-like ATPase
MSDSYGHREIILTDHQKEIYKADMAKKKTNVVKTQEIRTIETGLINKEEVFKMLALAEATGLPVLLEGPPGVGKTKTVIEYAKAWLNRDRNMSHEDFMNKLYVLETDEGTKSSEVKGMPDLGKLFTENKLEITAPIAEAEIVIINEVDKASSNIRNSLLGIMNEKFLFNGKHKIPCKWKLFIATCNEIPKEEVGSPFWDRFMLKMKVNRIAAGDMVKYFDNGGKDYKTSLTINVPNKDEIKAVSISSSKLEKFIEVAYSKITDRTMTFVPTLAAAVSYIWDVPIDKALIKTADIMVDNTASGQLMQLLISKEVKMLLKEIDALYSVKDPAEIDLAIAKIEGMANGFASKGAINEEQMDEIESALNYVLSNHDVKKRESQIESILSEALDAELTMESTVPNPF